MVAAPGDYNNDAGGLPAGTSWSAKSI